MCLNRDEGLLLPVCKAHELEAQPPRQHWLIESLWARQAVGLVGGPPKCCKSWLGLDMAVSVASATPCLGRFEVQAPGPALIYLAEDALPAVRARIEALCRHRSLDIAQLDVSVITAPALRLDLAQDQRRLDATLGAVRPALLLLDPLVRLHRLDENSAGDIARLLGFLRELQRRHQTAIVLVHHASKKQRAQPGQALRGSSDLHAFGDSNAYLSRRRNRLALTLEHRAAPAPEPLEIELVSRPDGSATHLEVCSPQPGPASDSLTERAWALLRHTQKPLTRTALRRQLRVNNQRLGDALDQLSRQGRAVQTPQGWAPAAPPPAGRPQPLQESLWERQPTS